MSTYLLANVFSHSINFHSFMFKTWKLNFVAHDIFLTVISLSGCQAYCDILNASRFSCLWYRLIQQNVRLSPSLCCYSIFSPTPLVSYSKNRNHIVAVHTPHFNHTLLSQVSSCMPLDWLLKRTTDITSEHQVAHLISCS